MGDSIKLWRGGIPAISKEKVLEEMHFMAGTEHYLQASADYDEILPVLYSSLRPAAAAAFCRMPDNCVPSLPIGTEVLGTVITLGSEIQSVADKFFIRGEYSKGLLANTAADQLLFEYEKEVFDKLKQECVRHKVGVRRRYEAPDQMPVSIQSYICHVLDAARNLGVRINRGNVLDPVKTLCFVFELSNDPREIALSHDCSNCEREDCEYA